MDQPSNALPPVHRATRNVSESSDNGGNGSGGLISRFRYSTNSVHSKGEFMYTILGNILLTETEVVALVPDSVIQPIVFTQMVSSFKLSKIYILIMVETEVVGLFPDSVIQPIEC